MKFLIASDFYAEFGLIEADNRLEAEAYIIDSMNGNEPDENIKILGSGDTMLVSEALEEAEETLFLSDYEY